jgi:hypothetical protein
VCVRVCVCVYTGTICEVLQGGNTTLTHLDLSRNRVRANGCTVLAGVLLMCC